MAGLFRLNRFLPRTLFARALMLLVIPIAVVQAVTIYLLFDRHGETVTRRLALSLGGEIALLIRTQGYFSPEAQATMTDMTLRNLELDVTWEPEASLGPRLEARRFFPGLQGTLERVLAERLLEPFIVKETPEGTIEVDVQLNDGVLKVVTPDKRVTSTTTAVVASWTIGLSAILLTIAIIFLKNQVRPIRRLAEAADAFGKGREGPQIRPAGALEVREATQAFLEMRDRIERQITQRTEMLAGVSHDLRSPLTRMKLELAFLGEGPAAEALRRDVAEVNERVEAYLAFARAQDGEPAAETDIAELLEDLVAEHIRRGCRIGLVADPDLVATVRPKALARAIGNLLDNALRHADRVEVVATRRPRLIEIAIDDDGPGIPPSERALIFHPAGPRTTDEAGRLGLGLSLARDVAHAHGGELLLQSAALGGLRVVVRLPV
ncbi:MAG: HAMP domain-containing protein [Alphaproteobacteria bacterium]|jgi:two-component system osmolarity sensor histidine kinase EnvZ|nr:HAMP domain-containing protein [Alphaproteobacteria bacterium]